MHVQNLVWYLHPRASDGVVAFDVGPWSLHAALIGSILVSTSVPATEALFLVGGIPVRFTVVFPSLFYLMFENRMLTRLMLAFVSSSTCQLLFPFFYHLDDLKHPTILSTGKDPSSDVDGLGAQLIRLISSILRGSESNRQDLVTSSGFGVLAYIFEEVSKEHLNMKLLAALDELVATLSVESLSLTRDAYLRLFFNFRVWSRAPYTLQKTFVITCVKHIQARAAVRSLLCFAPPVPHVLPRSLTLFHVN